MPQMMPLSWLMLFIMFSTTLILFAAVNYYTNIPKTKITQKKSTTMKTMNWKW
uniref:ATP synthase complex subunit 8 n=1 Tax=Postelectrotermes sp. 1 AB-2022a TaxID=2942747 RepID=A0A8X8M2E2_9NEOP|nr:ATP synthase F0 subunit 8 [Postelectrotermes sp. 1 AB-2022a]URX53671.1 ATP synthase F0 subunit 8 [Postelectrotermes sp. 1 AB-2022a]URX53736.1 ATP synthase F0 subunit 8 [Postelectrotermes sp. 1 AB-2022a]